MSPTPPGDPSDMADVVSIVSISITVLSVGSPGSEGHLALRLNRKFSDEAAVFRSVRKHGGLTKQVKHKC